VSARRIAACATIAVLTTTVFLTPAASAAAGPTVAQVGSYDAGSCGRLDTQIRPNGDLKLKVGKPKRFTIAFATERPCTLNVALRAFGNDDDAGGIVVGPADFTAIPMPGTFTWTVTGTRRADGFLAAYLSGGDVRFGIRLNDVNVR
jgi:hypothetical protein